MSDHYFQEHQHEPLHTKVLSGRELAFSLIEIVIALGLVSFALVSMVGLLLNGLKSTSESSDDTNLALCTETAQALLRAEGFTHAKANTAYAQDNTALDLFFDSTGVLQTGTNSVPLTTQNSESFYGCFITRHAPSLAQSTSNLLIFQLKFVWPLAAPASVRQQRIMITSLANYE